MVFFTCNACGEALKKGQVEKHLDRCPNCRGLSCMDCGKDFWGEDYKGHLKCLSEDQKYGGKNYEAKRHKGDVKQQEWIQKIHETIKKTSINPKVQEVLEQMSAYDNIPRKKRKFQQLLGKGFPTAKTHHQHRLNITPTPSPFNFSDVEEISHYMQVLRIIKIYDSDWEGEEYYSKLDGQQFENT